MRSVVRVGLLRLERSAMLVPSTPRSHQSFRVRVVGQWVSDVYDCPADTLGRMHLPQASIEVAHYGLDEEQQCDDEGQISPRRSRLTM